MQPPHHTTCSLELPWTRHTGTRIRKRERVFVPALSERLLDTSDRTLFLSPNYRPGSFCSQTGAITLQGNAQCDGGYVCAGGCKVGSRSSTRHDEGSHIRVRPLGVQPGFRLRIPMPSGNILYPWGVRATVLSAWDVQPRSWTQFMPRQYGRILFAQLWPGNGSSQSSSVLVPP